MENKHDVHYCANCPDKDTCADRQALEQTLSVDPAHVDALNRLIQSPELRQAADQDSSIMRELYASLLRTLPAATLIPPELLAHFAYSSYAAGYYRAQQNTPLTLPDAQEYPERER